VGEPIIHLVGQPTDRRAGLGVAMVAGAAVLFAINGSVSKVVLQSGLTSIQLTQARSIGAALRRLELTKDVVRRALPRLAATAEIEEREEGGYSLVDPLFAEWVGRLNDRALSSGSGSYDIEIEPGL